MFAEHFRHFATAASLIDKASLKLDIREETKMRIKM